MAANWLCVARTPLQLPTAEPASQLAPWRGPPLQVSSWRAPYSGLLHLEAVLPSSKAGAALRVLKFAATTRATAAPAKACGL
jgi:hypothetical protein